MVTGGHAKQPTGPQETRQEKEGDKTENGEMNLVHYGGIAWQQTAQGIAFSTALYTQAQAHS